MFRRKDLFNVDIGSSKTELVRRQMRLSTLAGLTPWIEPKMTHMSQNYKNSAAVSQQLRIPWCGGQHWQAELNGLFHRHVNQKGQRFL